MIRTLVEIQGGRVSIRETGTGQTKVSVIVDDSVSTVPLGGQEERLYTAEEVGDLQAGEAELVAAPLRRRIAQMTKEHADLVKRLGDAEMEVERLKKGHVCTRSCKPDAHVAFTGRQRLEELERKVVDYDLDRTTERDRADRMVAQIGKVNGAVHSPEVRDALARLEMSEADYVVSLANAVRQVRRAIGSPEPQTSQA